ncbi:helix-turn-helix domain-containing protein [Afifella marina]|uniref:Homeodomain-like domain-containing protein n=1 Tax=Afifella marina DSM 2698 TaxID=1120955 RepID=A0A1G5MF64_AFIMA|nr:helix-turn-helix domain-containing protein [Afifella marina]MBK1625214.1 hypothetical protein [Afifella marina DSM 2698]MBK1628931.1 hypothetical protein [Afifella marina]MBK5918310.1 hypothetical protein [Afifella marina]RAI22829.1 hypothetical protein CH311_04030 [Afifella marina DSM 2698]SCZ23827.1 Homeodomain-like domain-containing protein [Afifella marina DSM 2698]
MTRLPGILAEIAEVAGEEAAHAIARARGGTRVYLPGRADDDHWLTRCVGREAADAICRHFAAGGPDGSSGASYLIPLGQAGSTKGRRRALAAELRRGASVAEAARAVGMHERTAWRMRAKLQKDRDADQGELF